MTTTPATAAPKPAAPKPAAKPTAKPAAKPAAPKTAAPPPAAPPSPTQSPMNLLPAYSAMGMPDNVPLAELPPNAVLIGPEPDEAFVKNIREFQVLQPILLLKNPGGDYTVAAGRRRVKAARQVGLTTIPALVFPRGWVSHDVLTTIENQQRSENAAADLAAVEALLAQGASETQISEATGKAVLSLRQLLKLKGLIPELRAAFNEGKFTDRLAYKIICLKAPDQKLLISALAKHGKLINKDVDILIAATILPKPVPPASSATPATVPAHAAAAPAPEEDTRPWYAQVIDLVKRIQGLAPPTATDVLEIAEDMLKFVEYEGAQAVAAAPAMP